MNKGDFLALTNNREIPMRESLISRGLLSRIFLKEACRSSSFTEYLLKNFDRYANFNVVFGNIDKNEHYYFGSEDLHFTHDITSNISISNGTFHSKWTKMERGLNIMNKLVLKYPLLSELYSLSDEIWNMLMDTNKFSDYNLPRNTRFHEEVEYLLSSIFIAPFKMNNLFFGTVSSSQIIVQQNNQVTYIERRWNLSGNFDEKTITFFIDSNFQMFP